MEWKTDEKMSRETVGYDIWLSLVYENSAFRSASIVSPENKLTELLMSHRQRSDTCKKPGTAFTTEYNTPGRDVRTLVS
eukprot:2996450-Amphidinium_carterae.1